MTQQEAMNEAIEKAYLEIGITDIKSLYIDRFGYTQKRSLLPDFNNFAFQSRAVKGHKHTYKYRPFSLNNLETNNGWTRIESEEDLPENGRFKVCNIDKLKLSTKAQILLDQSFSWDSLFELFKDNLITHYKPIEPELLPIY